MHRFLSFHFPVWKIGLPAYFVTADFAESDPLMFVYS